MSRITHSEKATPFEVKVHFEEEKGGLAGAFRGTNPEEKMAAIQQRNGSSIAQIPGMAEEAKEEFLEFETAMRDFSTMFPSISQAEIERVLRANDGDVARTVDDLLLISLENV
ncbi:CUE domain protein [Ancylostoma ceylanicum]|uniref:CUE domain protein n=1 Tax=Ancylostoma ceylanicum TaxID=53326 RepID=A0A0D6LLH2_9BILA|nr:CUE domain protein [Ancylostoma ceylanicum]